MTPLLLAKLAGAWSPVKQKLPAPVEVTFGTRRVKLVKVSSVVAKKAQVPAGWLLLIDRLNWSTEIWALLLLS